MKKRELTTQFWVTLLMQIFPFNEVLTHFMSFNSDYFKKSIQKVFPINLEILPIMNREGYLAHINHFQKASSHVSV